MHTLENSALRLTVSDDGYEITLLDRQRNTAWRLRRDTRMVLLAGCEEELALESATVRSGDGRITLRYVLNGVGAVDSYLEYTWTLVGDYAEVSLVGNAPVVRAALPGAFAPVDESRWEIAVPTYQGCLIQPGGGVWRQDVFRGGHSSFSMSMAGVLTRRASLLISHESPANWRARYGEDASGLTVSFLHECCPVDGWRGATLRLYPCNEGVTALCRRYRSVLQQRGNWRPWSEKIAEKPILKNLFGALMAFVGYNRTDALDYVESARLLKARGFERIFFYPLRMCHYSLGFKMGGDEPTWHDDKMLDAMHELGGMYLAPWTWMFEGLDDGSDYMASIFRIHDGRPVKNWRMDDNQWFQVCPPYQIEYLKKSLAGDMAAMDWLHFDVSASVPGSTCQSTEHVLHGNVPMGGLANSEFTRQLMSVETIGNRVASSEGFSDYFCRDYDIGSTKIMPVQVAEGGFPLKMAVPMTLLALHDCCVHDWWELHNYNAQAAWPIGLAPNGIGIHGSGLPELKASMDALYGCPPNLFPFGKQYAWVDKPGGATKPYIIHLDDEPVQRAIEAALPVAALHARTGMADLVSLEFLDDARYLQASTFDNGVRVVANLGPCDVELEGVGRLAAHAWCEC